MQHLLRHCLPSQQCQHCKEAGREASLPQQQLLQYTPPSLMCCA